MGEGNKQGISAGGIILGGSDESILKWILVMVTQL